MKTYKLFLCGFTWFTRTIQNNPKKTHRKQPSIKIADIAIANGNLICPIGHQKFTVMVPPQQEISLKTVLSWNH